MSYFSSSPYSVVNGNIVYASDLNNPFTALETAMTSLVDDIQTGSGLNYATDTGVANAYAVSLNPAPDAYSEGLTVWLKPANSNTGESTINVNSLVAIEIRRHGLAVLQEGDILANYFVQLKYSGGYFQIVSMSGRADLAADRAEAAATSAEADAVLTAADVVSTAADVVSTNADAASTAADAIATAEDRVQTGIDAAAAAASATSVDADLLGQRTGPNGANKIETGTTAQRPANATGLFRYNTDLGCWEKNEGSGYSKATIGDPGKNLLYNALGRVNQEAVSGTVVLAAGEYGHDGFKAGSSGCTYTFAESGNTTTFTNSAGTLLQIIEDVDVPGGAVVASWTGTAQARIDSGSYGDSGEVTATLSEGTQAQIEFGVGTFSKPQLELGTLPTTFEYVPYEKDLRRCERYYVKLTFDGVQYIGKGDLQSTSVIRGIHNLWTATFLSTMRASPSISHNGESYFRIMFTQNYYTMSALTIGYAGVTATPTSALGTQKDSVLLVTQAGAIIEVDARL